MLSRLIDRMKLPFQKDRELRLSLYNIIGFYPHRIGLYRQALLHKSVSQRNQKGRPVNNERLEFLGDAILDAIVGDIVFEHFPGKREGFLTNTRSKLVQRDMLNRLADEMGISRLILSSGHSSSHNSYMGGNAFEALVGAIYLDRGYDACMRFMKKRILANIVNIDKVARKEVNFKSKLLEWSQKNRIKLTYEQISSAQDKDGSPMFEFQVVIEGIPGGSGTGYSKKESQQKASRVTLDRIKKDSRFIDKIYAAKAERMASGEKKTSPNAAEEAPKQQETVVKAAEEQPKAAVEPIQQPEQPAPTKSRTRKKKAAEKLPEATEKLPETVEQEPKASEVAEKPARKSRKKKTDKTEPAHEQAPVAEQQSESADATALEPAPQKKEKPARKRAPRKKKTAETPAAEPAQEVVQAEAPTQSADPDFDLSEISHRELSREEIIAAAEAAAFESEQQ